MERRGEIELRISDCGFGIADLGLRIWDCEFGIVNFGFGDSLSRLEITKSEIRNSKSAILIYSPSQLAETLLQRVRA